MIMDQNACSYKQSIYNNIQKNLLLIDMCWIFHKTYFSNNEVISLFSYYSESSVYSKKGIQIDLIFRLKTNHSIWVVWGIPHKQKIWPFRYCSDNPFVSFCISHRHMNNIAYKPSSLNILPNIINISIQWRTLLMTACAMPSSETDRPCSKVRPHAGSSTSHESCVCVPVWAPPGCFASSCPLRSACATAWRSFANVALCGGVVTNAIGCTSTAGT